MLIEVLLENFFFNHICLKFISIKLVICTQVEVRVGQKLSRRFERVALKLVKRSELNTKQEFGFSQVKNSFNVEQRSH